MKWDIALVILSGVFALLPVFCGLLVFRNAPQYIKVFYAFVCFTFLFDVLSTSMAFNGIHNEGMVKLYMLIEFGFFAWFLNWSIQHAMWPNWLILLMLSGAVLIWYLNLESTSAFNYFVLYLLVLTIVQSIWAFGFSSFLNSDMAFYQFITWILMGRFVGNVLLLFAYGLSAKFYFGSKMPYIGYLRMVLNSSASIAINFIYALALLKSQKFRKTK